MQSAGQGCVGALVGSLGSVRRNLATATLEFFLARSVVCAASGNEAVVWCWLKGCGNVGQLLETRSKALWGAAVEQKQGVAVLGSWGSGA